MYCITALAERGGKWLYGFCLKIYMRSSKIHQSKCVFHPLLGSLVCICRGSSPVSQQQRTRAGLGSWKGPGGKTWRMNVWIYVHLARFLLKDVCVSWRVCTVICKYEWFCVWATCFFLFLVSESWTIGLVNKNPILVRVSVSFICGSLCCQIGHLTFFFVLINTVDGAWYGRQLIIPLLGETVCEFPYSANFFLADFLSSCFM